MKKYMWILVLGACASLQASNGTPSTLDAQEQAKKLESERLEQQRIDAQLEDRRVEDRTIERRAEEKRLYDKH